LDELTENKINDNRAVEAPLEKISQPDLEEPWIPDSVVGRAESLQSNAALNSIDRKNRRNNTLFIGKFLSSKARHHKVLIYKRTVLYEKKFRRSRIDISSSRNYITFCEFSISDEVFTSALE